MKQINDQFNKPNRIDFEVAAESVTNLRKLFERVEIPRNTFLKCLPLIASQTEATSFLPTSQADMKNS